MNATRTMCRQGLLRAIDRSETTGSVVKRFHKVDIAGKVEDIAQKELGIKTSRTFHVIPILYFTPILNI